MYVKVEEKSLKNSNILMVTAKKRKRLEVTKDYQQLI